MPLSSTPIPDTSAATVADAYIVPMKAPELPALNTLATPIEAETYIYAGPVSGLSAELWSYEDFVRENAWKWVGRSALEDNYAEVDHRREMNGKTLRTEIGSGGESQTVAVHVEG